MTGGRFALTVHFWEDIRPTIGHLTSLLLMVFSSQSCEMVKKTTLA